MLKRYDANKDEMVEVTQEWIDEFQKHTKALALHYKENAPNSFKQFYMEYASTGKVTENA